MPLKGVRYRVKQTPKGSVRLAFRGKKTVVEAKNLKTGAIHTPEEFAKDRRMQKSIQGSGTFNESELRQGYKKMQTEKFFAIRDFQTGNRLLAPDIKNMPGSRTVKPPRKI